MPKADLQYQARNDAQGDRMRHFQWGALGASSLMALVGIVSRFETDSIENEKREVQWVVSATSIVLAVATFSIVCHFAARQAYVGSFLEGGLSIFTTALWAGTLPIVMDPDYRLTVTSRYGDISNPILYFFSWAAIIVSYFIMVGYLMKRYSEWCERPPYAIYSSSSSPWVLVGFILTCFVVMMSANRMVIEGHCVDNDEDSDISRDWSDPTLPSKEVCNRLTSGTSAGTVSLVIYFVWLVINAIVVDEKYDGMLLIDVFLSGAMLFLWTFAAVWLTFDENESPAKDVCNLFFFTWASWVLSLIMAMNGFHYTVKLLTTSQKAPAIPAPERNFKRNEARLGDGHDVEGLTHSTLDDKPVEVDRSCS